MSLEAIDRLSGLVGIPSGYRDAFGDWIEVGSARRAAMLDRLGFPTGDEREAAASIALAEDLRGRVVPRSIAVLAEAEPCLPVAAAAGMVGWRLTDEAGRIREGHAAVVDGRITLPALPAGYHRLALDIAGAEAEATIIAAPACAWQPDWMSDEARLWGLSAQVYGLRSESDLGIGGYGEVKRAAAEAGPLGAAFLGLSPVHALFGADRAKVSPYSPSSRLFLETIHIDPRALPGFAGSRAAALLEEPGRAARIAALRDLALVDHAGVWAELAPVLEAYFEDRREAIEHGLAAFRRESGPALEAHAVFEALSEHFRREGRWWLGDWPPEFRLAGTPDVQAFARENAERVAFHAWLQMVADDQLAAAHQAACESGMALGLYRDLAVGSDRGGSEVWSAPDLYAQTLSIGAPPDLLAPQGQDWGLPPLHPLMLQASGLQAFRALVRANLRHAGAIRIDHAFQLSRLYLMPVGAPGSEGAYVEYPVEAMLAVLRLESHRAKALVIAEDLGTAPEGFSDAIMASGILSYRVLAFEREADGAFKPPAAYPRNAMAVVSTHDLPTLAGWWRGLDTDLRQGLGIYDPDRADHERAERARDRASLVAALAGEGTFAGDPAELPEAAPSEAVIRYLARTPSAVMAVQYEDVLGTLNQANIPGTTEGHPNWRRKLEADLGTIDAPGGPLAKVAAALAAEGRGPREATTPLAAPPPRATYRLQFHAGFTFDDAIAILPYLAKLGISHVYASPIHRARPGSTHGYDIVDHAEVNPELGGLDGFVRLTDALRDRGLGLILDIVPNHMGVGGADNGDWLSVLEWGALSPFASTFDIDWERLGAGGKLVVPVLGERYGEALEKGDLRLSFDPAEGSFSVHHHEHRLLLSPLTYPLILDRALAALDSLEGQGELIAISDRLRAMQEEAAPDRRAAFPEEAEALKRRLAEAVAGSAALAGAAERAVSVVNGVPGMAESFGTLHRILDMQAYRPAHWRVAASEINYRRFFDINGLAGVRIEEPEVFSRTHELIFDLVRQGRIQGLRIDHVDGLADPEGYLKAVQAEIGPGFYVVVEKILEPGEELRPWQVSGTTGYDVLNLIDGIMIREENGARFETIYRAASGLEGRYFDLLREAKTEILQSSFASELEVLVSDLKRIADSDRRTRDYTAHGMRIALSEIIARFPVYRSYLTEGEVSPADLGLVEETIASARRHSALPDHSVHGFVADCLLGRIETSGPGRPTAEHVARFRRRFQQLTGPVMAKSLEDTLFYRYARLIALNEVGGDPAHFGVSIERFHAENAERARLWPDAMIATATHDTKRGEDARARLAALSEVPEDWEAALAEWERLTAPHLRDIDGVPAPDANDGTILLQTILGAWPLELLGEGVAHPPLEGEGELLAAFASRLHGFVEKALREAKRHTSWVNVDEAYESAAKDLVSALLAPSSEFLTSFRPLAARLAEAGMRNGLVRTALKATLPGVPDIYQGSEFWDLSLVDPDNRRPVDYAAREAALADGGMAADLVSRWPDGRVKQAVIAALLVDRARSPGLYADGDYRPLLAGGGDGGRILAFAREHGGEALVTAALRFPLSGGSIAESRVPVPEGNWHDRLSGRTFDVGPTGLTGRELFASLPVAVLRRTV
ncbi:malto-oligosyltrehalose synthase [Enterovirga rhinocerotis]|uniref:4-alpha-glucanotransferase n=1 Tax=Enterovirga rhinocerotis TaxID=1339210 RepID=A0A4R7BZU6_9HYPH|nr:malto-oligosyltrehalose synthase [Enterovirga rhinocerotis]TDR89747.1 maltooligosyl trehalose synthase [Enterovirga rhinocerotis]